MTDRGYGGTGSLQQASWPLMADLALGTRRATAMNSWAACYKNLAWIQNMVQETSGCKGSYVPNISPDLIAGMGQTDVREAQQM